MARPRTPKAKAEITGHADKQKTKFQNRDEPTVEDGAVGIEMTDLTARSGGFIGIQRRLVEF